MKDLTRHCSECDGWGTITIEHNGTDYYVSSWVKEGKTGKFLSLSFKPVQEQTQSGKQSYGNKDFDDFLNNL